MSLSASVSIHASRADSLIELELRHPQRALGEGGVRVGLKEFVRYASELDARRLFTTNNLFACPPELMPQAFECLVTELVEQLCAYLGRRGPEQLERCFL